MNKIGILILSIIIFGCSRETDPIGPSLDDIYGPFTVLQDFQASTQLVDFQNGGTVTFSARFSKTVDWELLVIGETSGAVKRFEGKTRVVDEENSLWDGTTTDLPMFKQESCLAILNVAEEGFSDTLDPILIDSIRVVDGIVVTDWENGVNPGFNVFVQSGANMRFDTVVDVTGPEGNVFYEMSGSVTFIEDLGNILMPKSAWTNSEDTLSENPEIVYFNFFLKKEPQIANEILVFQVMEDDNQDGSFDPGSEDLYEFVLSGFPENWEQVSVRYTQFASDDPNGNGIKEPNKLHQILMIPVSGQRTPFAGFVDYLIFTENEPLVP